MRHLDIIDTLQTLALLQAQTNTKLITDHYQHIVKMGISFCDVTGKKEAGTEFERFYFNEV